MGTAILPFTEGYADVAARLWFNTRSQGLSLADRACPGLAVVIGVPFGRPPGLRRRNLGSYWRDFVKIYSLNDSRIRQGSPNNLFL